ncbi:MAG: methionyl-tRNA formyltransferase [Polymorphobacter sp.]|uniref:methionyl-tRNA formyltransferase n=1 Tax=Polymorphobacter sp. TaxID=1909290 RepID=UPI003A84F264
MRIIFMGTPAFAVPALDALHASGHSIAAVYTRPPQPAGRGKALRKSDVHARAEVLGLPVETPQSLRATDAQATFSAYAPDVAVVAAYGLILPQAVLDIPALGCLNIHASLLPRWRGAAPIQRAILAGDETTGVTIMQMEAGLDTGPLLAAEATPVDRKTAGALTEELALLGARLMCDVLRERPAATPQPQDGVTHAAKLQKAEAELDFNQPAAALERAIRAFNPAPGAFTSLAGERLKILAADILPGQGEPGITLDDALTIGTADGLLRPTLLQRAGKPAMDRDALLRGWPIPAGTRLG